MSPKARIALTGLWLGLVQTGLGYAVLVDAGSSVLLFFLTVTVWIAGGAAGVLLPFGRSRPLLFAAGAGCAAAVGALAAWPFEAGSTALALCAGAGAGIFAGRFIALQSAALGDARPVLFIENNGFATGLALGLALLFADPLLLAGGAAALWGGLLLE
jgi:hypothetical protein